MEAQPYLRPAIEQAQAMMPQFAADADSTEEFVSLMMDATASIARSIVPVDTGALQSSIEVVETGRTPPEPEWSDMVLSGTGDKGHDDYEGPHDGANG